jgi:DNA-binding CsgD family transcriptional regulator
MNSSDPQPQSSVLTPRELEVISLLVRGNSNAQIAADLGLSARTVYGMVDAVKRKLGVSTRAELLRHVREHGVK